MMINFNSLAICIAYLASATQVLFGASHRTSLKFGADSSVGQDRSQPKFTVFTPRSAMLSIHSLTTPINASGHPCTPQHNKETTTLPRMMIRAAVIWIVAVLVVGPLGHAGRPNILLIVSDDQGYNDLGILGNGIITPNLDRLAREGTRLSNFYVTWPACTPSRASLLTGRYPQRNGIYDMIRNEAPDYGYKYSDSEYEVTFERIGGMDVREVTIADVLKADGYHTAIFGKWDLGSLKRFLPTSRGFDEFYGFVNTGIDYFTHERYGAPSMYRNENKTVEDKGTYCTKLFERESLRFLDQWAGREPFFLYVPFNAPHSSSALDPAIRSSVQAPEEFKRMYPKIETELRRTEKYRYGSPTNVTTPQARQRDYRAAVTCMDEAIGKMISRLEQKRCLDNTIIIFFSDNGGGGGADNSPLNGKKATMWEGGVRVPCIVRWPSGGVPANVVNDEFLTSLELFPSLTEATSTNRKDQITLDGMDWWPVLCQGRPSPRTRSVLETTRSDCGTSRQMEVDPAWPAARPTV